MVAANGEWIDGETIDEPDLNRSTNVTGIVSATGKTPTTTNTDFSVTLTYARRWGPFLSFRVEFTPQTGTFTTDSGNIANREVGQLVGDAALGSFGYAQPISSVAAGGAWGYYFANTGVIVLAATLPNLTITPGTTMSLGGVVLVD